MDPVTLGLAVAQVAVPIALVAMPVVWIKIMEVLRRIPRISKDHPGHNTNLAIIHSILDSLVHMRDHAWIQQSNNRSLLNHLKLKADSVENMINNDKGILQYLHRGKIAKTIRSIALMMQLLETNARVRQASTSIKSDRLDLAFYQKSRENLCKDLLDILDKDDLEPVVIRTWREASIRISGTYTRIVYEFKCEPEHGYPRTLCISRGVRECLEALLKWLRDLKLLQDTINTGCSSLLGVALYELFSDVLPKVLMQHLRGGQRSKLNAKTANQFYLNVRFLRSFSVSPTFKAIQGEDGLHLEDEDKITIDLRNDGWVTWNDVERESSSTFRLENHRSSSLEVAGPSSRGGASTTRSVNMDPLECTLCGLVIKGNSRHEDTLRFEQHWDACFRKEQGLNDYNAIHQRCPVCGISIDDLSFDLRQLHTNACLDGN